MLAQTRLGNLANYHTLVPQRTCRAAARARCCLRRGDPKTQEPQSRSCYGDSAVAAVMATPEAAAKGEMDIGLIRKAMALRVKYRVLLHGNRKKKRIPLALLGVHKMNRGGVYPQEDTVANLGVNLLTKGFNEDEANHAGVCVPEVPAEERRLDLVLTTAPYETYAVYNVRSCEYGSLKTCFT